jgi:hypothetical protein
MLSADEASFDSMSGIWTPQAEHFAEVGCELELYSTSNSGFFVIMQSLRRAAISRQPAPTNLRTVSPRQVSPKYCEGEIPIMACRNYRALAATQIDIEEETKLGKDGSVPID